MNNKDLEIENNLVFTHLLKELRPSVRRKYKALNNISKAFISNMSHSIN